MVGRPAVKFNLPGQRHVPIWACGVALRRRPPHGIIGGMTTDPRLTDALARLPDYLGSHVLVSVTALALGLGISLPLAILSVRRPVLRAGLLGAASVV